MFNHNVFLRILISKQFFVFTYICLYVFPFNISRSKSELLMVFISYFARRIVKN